MNVSINSIEEITHRFRSAVDHLIEEEVLTDLDDAIETFKLNRKKYLTDSWQPTRRNVELIVKRGSINALWLYTDCQDVPMLKTSDLVT